ncbi:MAG TPA: DinB family protein [Ktedonosporobacter sp.]|nr:DinB family protein [Ktedonosporobacter sp.]
MPTRQEILSTLAEERANLLAHYQSFSPEALAQSCTQSEVPGASPWCPKDHLAHLARIERSFQVIAGRTLKGAPNPIGLNIADPAKRAEVVAQIHRDNQANIEAHHTDDIQTLLADLATTRQDTLTFIEQLTDEQLATPVPGAPWGDGTIGGVLMTNALHEKRHLAWVEEGLQQKE